MYESHFGFSGSPFALNPDPAFYFNSKGHGRALGYLQYGVMQGEGFIVITGEIGAGKTTLVRTLIEGLDRQKVLAAQIVSTQLESGELLQAIITAFGIPSQGSSKAHLIATLEAFFTALAAQGRHALLIVDEAQNLNEQAVEELRMLSNFQLGNHALLQSFLVGQPELRRLLESSKMEQLRQRVIASQHLGPLGPDETAAYIEHRLRRVGWTQRPAFGSAAFDHIYAWTGGVPRRINRLANRLLLAAYLENLEEISSDLVVQTAQELRAEIGEAGFEPLPLPVRPAAAPANPGVSPVAPVTAAGAPATPTQTMPPPPDAPVVPEPALATAPAAPVDLPTEDEPLDQRADEAVAQAAALLREIEAARAEESRSASSGAGHTATVIESAAGPTETPVALPQESASSTPPDVPLAPDSAVGTEPDEVVEMQSALSNGPAGELIPEAPALEDVRAGFAPLEDAGVAVDPKPVRRVEKPGATSPGRPVLLCMADNTASALAFAALSRELTQGDLAARVVLVNPGSAGQVWPWPPMERLLPTLEVGLDLGVPAGEFAALVAPLFARLAHVLNEFRPAALITLGDSDAMLAAALLARKSAVPLVRLDAGAREAGEGQDVANATLLDQMADLLLVDSALSLPVLNRLGVAPERIRVTGGGLLAEALKALWPEVTTPYGVFMRHAMPIYLGPTWSSHAGAGTPYGVIRCALECEPMALREQLRLVAQLTHPGKWVWLLDEVDLNRLITLSQEEPELFEKLHLLQGEGPRGGPERDRMDQAAALLRVMPSLADQLGVLRGASCLLADGGDALAGAANRMGIPCLSRRAGRYWLPAAGHARASVAAGPDVDGVNSALAELLALQPTDQLHDLEPGPSGRAGETAALLWSGLRCSRQGGEAAGA
jgi:putative secretion ATPase (PEP-CTERM system associated)